MSAACVLSVCCGLGLKLALVILALAPHFLPTRLCQVPWTATTATPSRTMHLMRCSSPSYCVCLSTSRGACSAFCSLSRRTVLGRLFNRIRPHFLRRLPQQHRSLRAIRSNVRLFLPSVRHRTRPWYLPCSRWRSAAFVPDRLPSRSRSLSPDRSSLNRCRSRFLLRLHQFPGRLSFTLKLKCISIRPHSTCRASCRAPIRHAITDVAGSTTLAVRIRTDITFAPPATVMAGVADRASDCLGPAVRKALLSAVAFLFSRASCDMSVMP